jgi:cytochrome c oxidase subunit I+III
MVFPLFAGLYYWTPLVTGRMLSERLGRWAFWLMFIGFNVAFLPMHLTGLLGMPRRIYTYSGELGWNALNLTTSVFSFVFAAGVLVVACDFVRHLRKGPEAESDPWGAPSLEWLSGLAPYGFRSLVPITTRYPMWEQPGLADEMMAGRGYLPDAPTGERETLLSTVVGSEPQQILRLPSPGWTAFTAALATAVVFTALTLKLAVLGVAAGVVAVAMILYWLWSMDRAYPREPVDAGRGTVLPLYSNGSDSVGWWGMAVLLIADAVVVASFIFAYLFFWTARPTVWPPVAAGLPGFSEPATIVGAVLGAWALYEVAERSNRRDRRLATALCLTASALFAGTVLVMGWRWLDGLGISATVHSYGAAVWLLLGYVALHVAMGIAMAFWCLARLALGMIDSWRSLTLRVCLLWWRFTVPVATLTLLLVAGFPHVVH